MERGTGGADDRVSVLDSLAAPSVVLDGDGAVRAANVSFVEYQVAGHRCLPLREAGQSFVDAFAEHRPGLLGVLAGDRDDARTEWQCPDLACGRWWSIRTRPLRG